MKFLAIIPLLLIIWFLVRNLRRRKSAAVVIPAESTHELLQKHVRFYRNLDEKGQASFRTRVNHFLDRVAITPVGDVQVTDLDRLYVAASAIIPIFHFSDWAYNNLNEVLIYPGVFTKDFMGVPEDQNVLGMVGDGAMHRMMVLSIQALRNGFEQQGSGNTGIHEFVHLLDKADGAIDGVPETMIPGELIGPWIKYMHRAIAEIRSDESDINPYAGTNEAEFFAVVSEYFFQKPDILRRDHPELMRILESIYQHPVAN